MQIGIPGCDVDVACQLACYGFGDSLLQAAFMLPFLQFMEYIANWRRDLCDALSTDPRGYLQQLHRGLAQVIQLELLQFPDLPAVALYASPLTSWSNGRVPSDEDIAVVARQPDLPAISTICSQHFGLSGDGLVQKLNDSCTGVVTCTLLQVSIAICPRSFLSSAHQKSWVESASWRSQ